MRILHTSDWHLGKRLEMSSRIEEQRQFIDELSVIADEKDIDLVIVAGDIYDSINPPAEGERLFYQGVSRLSKYGKRPVLIVAGNHDSPERLTASSPLASMHGVILIGTPRSVADTGDYEHFSIADSGEGYIELHLNGEKLVAVTIPYPSEKRLNEIFTESLDEQTAQRNYSDKIRSMFEALSQKYRDETINIAVGHFYIAGGETSASERDIQLGGAYAVEPSALPRQAQYLAMGHLHRPQSVGGYSGAAYYSGSPIQYSKSELGYAKAVYIAELYPGMDAAVEKVYLSNYKPIEIWKADGIEAAISMCEDRKAQNCWVYLEIYTDRPLLQSEIHALKTAKTDIVEIRPVLYGEEMQEEQESEDKTLVQEFCEYYAERRGTAPSDELVELFRGFAGDAEVMG